MLLELCAALRLGSVRTDLHRENHADTPCFANKPMQTTNDLSGIIYFLFLTHTHTIIRLSKLESMETGQE